MKTNLAIIVESIIKDYDEHGEINQIGEANLPFREEVIQITRDLLALVFPGYFGKKHLTADNLNNVTTTHITDVYERLSTQIELSLKHACDRNKNCEMTECMENSHRCATWLLESLPSLRIILRTDVEAAYKGDPACYSHEEAIFCYPGLLAIAIQRIAHELHKYNVPLIPRMMTEYAHRQTGVDIHPGATIGEHFFIDHATGVVIGETTVIGNNVKIYQGVTLGAKSFPEDAREIRHKKRHPTIEDNVIIYANAAILGNITIGKGSVIGGNTWITQSVAPETTIVIEPPKMRVKEKK